MSGASRIWPPCRRRSSLPSGGGALSAPYSSFHSYLPSFHSFLHSYILPSIPGTSLIRMSPSVQPRHRRKHFGRQIVALGPAAAPTEAFRAPNRRPRSSCGTDGSTFCLQTPPSVQARHLWKRYPASSAALGPSEAPPGAISRLRCFPRSSSGTDGSIPGLQALPSVQLWDLRKRLADLFPRIRRQEYLHTYQPELLRLTINVNLCTAGDGRRAAGRP